MREKFLTIRLPLGGLRGDVGSTDIDPKESPFLEEIKFYNGSLGKASGARYLETISGKVLLLKELKGTLFAHTSRKLFFYNPASKSFLEAEDISDQAVGYGTAWEDATDAWEDQVGSWLAQVTYSGSEDEAVFSTLMSDKLIWTNGLDSPRMYSFGAVKCEELTNWDSYIVGCVLQFGGRLCGYKIQEGSTLHRKRVQWSVVGDATDITGTGSGFSDPEVLSDSSEILRAEKLGNYVVIYANDALCLQEYTGITTNPFSFTTRIPQLGLAAARALVNINNGMHIFLGEQDIYSYSGGMQIQPIGGKIRNELFSLMNPRYIHRSFMTYNKAFNRIRLFFPAESATSPNRYYELDLTTGAWSRGTRSYTAGGSFTKYADSTWAEALGNWDDHGETWEAKSLRDNFETQVYGDASGRIFEDDFGVIDINGEALSCRFDTKDFTADPLYKDNMVYWMEVNFEGFGDSVDVYTSVDGGDTFTFMETISLTQDWRKYQVGFELYSNQFRVSFRNSSKGEVFKLREFDIGYIPSTREANLQQ